MIPIWDDKYSIGNTKIDAQHKRLFDLAATAFIYAEKNISREQMKEILSGFFEYMKTHFSDEEAYMRSISYPRLEKHSKIHKSIISDMSSLITETNNLNEMKENLVVIAKSWLLEHILQEDMLIEKWYDNFLLRQKHPEMNLAEFDPDKAAVAISRSGEQQKDDKQESIAPKQEPKLEPKEKINETFEYVCGCEGKIHRVSRTIHEKILAGSVFTCKVCKQKIRAK